MELTYKNYVAKSEDDRFNLYILKPAVAAQDGLKHKAGEKYTKEWIIGYGYSYQGLVNKIARLELAARQETHQLHEYVEMFNQVVTRITLIKA